MLSEAPKDPFRTRDHVAEFDDVVDAFRELSRDTRLKLRSELNVPYGNGLAETLDIFYPPYSAGTLGTRSPVHIFIHGGYWRMFSKDDFSYVADTVTAAGAIAVVLDYALMPTHRMALLIDQVRRATGWIAKEIGRLGGDPFSMSVSGHSAGAHLATWLLDRRDTHPDYRVASCFLLGGLYDLKPLQNSFLQPDLALSDEEVERWTPLATSHRTDCAYSVHVGEEETAPFREQAALFHRKLIDDGCASSLTAIKATNHMTSVLSLGNPQSTAGRGLISTVDKSRATRPQQHHAPR